MWIHLTEKEALAVQALLSPAPPIKSLEEKIIQARKDTTEFRDQLGVARHHYEGDRSSLIPDGEIQIDLDCAYSDADKGVWVMGWLYVPIGSQ